MTSRDRTALAVVVALAAIVGAWFLLVAPKRSEANRLGAQITATQRQLAVENGIVAAGEAARHRFASLYTELTSLERAVPTDDDVPALIVQLQRAASGARVDFRSLLLSGSAGATPAPGAALSTTTSVNGRTVGTAPTTPGATSSLPPGVSVGPAGLPQEPFTFSFTGSFFHLADFLGRLQRFVVARNDAVSVSGRLMTLNAITLNAGPSGFPQITATINATTYLVPAGAGTAAAVAAGSGVPTSTPASGSAQAAPSAPTATVTP